MNRQHNKVLLNTCLENIDNKLNVSNTNIKNIVVDSTTLGYESILTDTLDSISNLIYKGLFGIRDMILDTSMIVDNVKQYSTTTPNIKRLNEISKKVSKVVAEDKLNISKIYNTQAPVMLGLNISLEDMYKSISDITIFTATLTDTLNNLEDFLNNITSSKIEDIKHLLPRDNKISKIVENNKTVLTTLNTFNSKSIMSDRKPVKDLISKVATLPILIDNSIKLGKYYRIETLQDIHTQTVSISVLADAVIKTLNVKDNIDKNTLYKLSNYLKVVAENITMVSFTYYSYYSLLDMLVGVSKIVINTKPKANKIKDKEATFTSGILNIFN